MSIERHVCASISQVHTQIPAAKAFPDDKSGTHDPVLTDAAAMSGAPDNHVFEDINVEFPVRHSRPHDPNSFSYSDGSAKKVDGSPKGIRTEHLRQASSCCWYLHGYGPAYGA